MNAAPKPPIPAYLATVGSAALLISVQPMLGKQILPLFGGGSAVWSGCLLFFQTGLVVGYAYAHLSRGLGVARQRRLHIALLAVSLLTLPFIGMHWSPSGSTTYVSVAVMVVLAGKIGLPYVLLGSTSPLVQDWLEGQSAPSSSESGGDTGRMGAYRLYGLSNAASLVGVLAYPVVLEPSVTLRGQTQIWSAGYLAFAVLCAWCAMGVPAAGKQIPDSMRSPQSPPTPFSSVLSWLSFSAIGSALLVATTTALTQDIAPVPLLWLGPLGLYLVSFIVAFSGWYRRPLSIFFYLNFVFLMAWLGRKEAIDDYLFQGIVLLGGLFCGCLICHGELVRRRPPATNLTTYYLTISIGGAVGTALVAIAAPLFLNALSELPILHTGLVAIAVAIAAATMTSSLKPSARASATAVVAVTAAAIGAAGFRSAPRVPGTLLEQARSPYGVLKVVDDSSRNLRQLYHGRILHGSQFIDPSSEGVLTSYYGEGSGVALAVQHHPRRLRKLQLRIGVIGLGAGTVAALADAGDTVRFFEIDPLVIRLSNQYFSFLANSKGTVSIRTGDGRLVLQEELRQAGGTRPYDLIVLDAFAGDAIPFHLLTAEAHSLYWMLLADDGVLAFHLSNRFLDLRPLVRGLADASGLGLQTLEVRHVEVSPGAAPSLWMLTSRNRSFMESIRPSSVSATGGRQVVWTDDFNSLVSVWSKSRNRNGPAR